MSSRTHCHERHIDLEGALRGRARPTDPTLVFEPRDNGPDTVAQRGADGADVVVLRRRMAPGEVVPLHSHLDTERFSVLAGTLSVLLVDTVPCWHSVEPGCSLLVESGVQHVVRNNTDRPTDLIVTTTKRLADVFAAMAKLAAARPQPAPFEDRKRIEEIAEACGCWFSSPAEHAGAMGSLDFQPR